MKLIKIGVFTRIKAGIMVLSVLLISDPIAAAAEKSIAELLTQFQQEEPEIFERARLVEENERRLLELSLQDTLHLVQRRSVTLQALRMGEQTAESQLKLVDEMFQPQFKTSVSHARSASLAATDLRNDSPLTPYMSAVETNSLLLSAAWSRRTQSGLTYSATAQKITQQSRRHTMAESGDGFSGGETTDDPLETTRFSFGVSVPFFQDAGDINRLPYRRAQLGIDQNRLSTYSTSTGLLKNVAQTYWTLVGVRENIRTTQEAVQLSEQLYRETEIRVEVGILNLTDLKEAEIQLATQQKNLLSARISEQEIEDQIRVALDLEGVPIGFKPADTPRVRQEVPDYETQLTKTYRYNSDLRLLTISLQANQLDLDEALNKQKTNLDLDASYTLSGYGAGIGESMQNLAQDKLHGYQIGLNWTIPLYDKATPEKIAKAKLEKARLELRINDIQSQLAVSLQTLLRNLRFGMEEEKSAVLSRSLAKDLMEKEIEKLRLGKSTGFNVAQAQQRYTNAGYAETMVRVKNEQTYIALLALTGELYDHFNLPSGIDLD
jgi:outer membrane protein